MRLSQLGLPIGVGAIAVGATILTAPAAHALPESTIKNECDEANGQYKTEIDSIGRRWSECCYKAQDGTKSCDEYFDGVYQGTYPATGAGTETTPPNRRPVSPPTAPIAPPVAVP